MTIEPQTLGILFVALLTVYSPLSNVGAYASVTAHLSRENQKRLALRVFRNALVVMLVLVWAGRALFEILGVSPDTVRVAGAIALLAAGLPMMLGTREPEDPGDATEKTWQEMVSIPMTFPMTIGGATAVYLVTANGLASSVVDLMAISVVVVAFAGVILATHWLSPPIASRLSAQGQQVLTRVAGIVLVAIAVDLMAGGLRELLPGLAA
jgi:multiple antibiotic resistance protein